MEQDDDNNFLTGFLFGNVNQKGQLEDDDLLDEESKRHLGALALLDGEMNVKSLLSDISESDDGKDGDPHPDMRSEKSPSAIDYSDINELIEEDEMEDTPMVSYPMLPPPVPAAQTSSELAGSEFTDRPSKYLNTPLGDMLPPEFKGVDVREFFPDFRMGEVLRFSKLFPPQYPISIYKRKKKMDEGEKLPNKKPQLEMDWGAEPEPGLLMRDEQETFLEPLMDKKSQSNLNTNKDSKSTDELNSNAWRYGPAQYWFDLYDIEPDASTFDYGLKKSERTKETQKVDEVLEDTKSEETELTVPTLEYPEESFLMVSQTQWEDDIIWSGDENRIAITQSQKSKAAVAGWICTPTCRTVEHYAQANKIPYTFDPNSKKFQSFFPIENDDLVYTAWENWVLWDLDKVQDLPPPKGLTLDLNDDNIVYEIPEDKEPNSQEKDLQQAPGVKKEPRKSQLALQKIGIVKEKEEQDENDQNTNQPKDPFNLSNDEYYNPKIATDNALRTNVGGNLIQHSTPAVDLKHPFFPTYLGVNKLRQYHRPPLKKYSHGPMAMQGPIPVQSLQKLIKRKAKLRDQERQAMGGGEIFFMRTPQDLTACDGDLIFAEYSEEFPPVLMQPGMATKIKNYYKRKPGGDKPPDLPYGELAYAHHSPFLGNLAPGQTLQAFENNMYRAPVYQHLVPDTDFLIIRNRQTYFVRKVPDIFCVGQLCPLMEVPGPNSKRANIFMRDFLQSFIYRLFWASVDTPRRIKMEDIKKAFQSHSESSIRKRLKLCADFKRTGMDSNWWVIKPDFRLPSHEEIRAMVSPEQCCAFYSMISAEQRLRDAGYGEKSLFAPEQDEDDEAKIEDEVKTAPWNTTRAYIQAVKGKCLLSLTGVVDPTGCGEGFAYVRIPNKPIINKAEQSQTPQKKTVTGTTADLRRLNLADAKKILRDKGFPEAEIKKLSRWEVIDCVRTMSTREAKTGEEGGMTKFARGNRFSVAEHQERYKEECQRLFELQNKILCSDEILSTDEEGSDTNSENSDYDEMGKHLESMLTNKKSSSELTKEREEAELKQLHKSLLQPNKGKDKQDNSLDQSSEIKSGVRKLMITRTFKDEAEGRIYTRVEWVTKPLVIEAYLKIRKNKSPEFIKQFASLDENQKEEMKRERRRIQEQLRRIKRNEMKLAMKSESELSGQNMNNNKKKKKENMKEIKLKCGACGQVGHMRTNKECPLYAGGGGGGGGGGRGSQNPLTVALTEEEEEKVEKQVITTDENLIHVEGTKLTLSKQLIEAAENIKKQTLTLKFPKNIQNPQKEMKNLKNKRKKAGTSIHCDYLTRPNKVAHRRRADPLVSLCSILENIINDLRDIPNSAPFHHPVNPKVVSDYHRIINRPMDLQTMRTNVRERKYENREQFLADVAQIFENSKLYNGPKSVYTLTAQNMLELTLRRFAEKEDKFMRLEKAINPLLDDDDQVSFSYILENILENHLKNIENVWPFLTPVNKKTLKDYYDIIEKPMDLQTLAENIKKHKYHSCEEFLADVELIHANCVRYNGLDSNYTSTANKIFEMAKRCIKENEDQLQEMEQGIRIKQEAAMEGLESESAITGTSLRDDDMDDDTRGDYTIIEGGESSSFNNMGLSFNESQIGTHNTNEDEDYVDIMDDESANQTRDYGYEQDEATNQDSTLGMDLHLSGDEDEENGQSVVYAREGPSALDEDSQMSFNAEMFFQTNFNTTGQYQTDENAQDGQSIDVVHNDLHLSDSDEDNNVPNTGPGFDFDEFDD